MAERQTTDLEFWQRTEPLLNRALEQLNTVGLKGAVPDVIEHFLDRLRSTIYVLLTLERFHSHPFAHEACTLLRSAYDAYVQAAFILSDPAHAVQRAMDYRDFVHIERFRFIQRVQASSTPLRDQVLSSPLREAGEPKVRAEYERVRSRFVRPNGGLWTNWYRSDLRQLAQQIGLAEEYDLVLAGLHLRSICTARGTAYSSA